MTLEEFNRVIKEIHLAFPGKRMDLDTLEIWHRHLSECRYPAVKQRLDAYIRQHSYRPALAHLYVRDETETTVLDMMKEWEREGEKKIGDRRYRDKLRPPWEE
ncbi:hypothetical protein B9K06_18725 [Bacillus sp. OG2]|nr:hypothetical protein B9K06_18725 [Bacillus sp. OG2]